MSFQEEKRESIKRYLLEKIRQNDEDYIKKTVENFGISVTTVKRYLKDCLEKEILREEKESKTGYAMCTSSHTFSYKREKCLSEDRIYYEDILPFIESSSAILSKEARTIWSYSFMEMMNNAIEHSQCEEICCSVTQDYLYTEISIRDDGIGIYKNIQKHLKEQSEQSNIQEEITYQDVVMELYKGKLTTNRQNHSGEGIFFTSKVLNEFVIWSEDTIFSFGCYDKKKLVQSHLIQYYNRLNEIGTMVVMKLENQTTRKIEEVFNMFAPIDEGFIKTRIPIKEVCPYGEPIARSQARRILYRLEEFKQVELDFTGVEFMGQGFADEIFRVFLQKHPEIELIPIHACKSVLGMIKHVQKS